MSLVIEERAFHTISEGARAQRRREAVARLHVALHEVYQCCPTLPVLAIRWLHLKHPLQEEQETLLRDGEAHGEGRAPVSGHGMHARAIVAWRLARCLLFSGYLSVCVLRLRLMLRGPRRLLSRQRFDVIARTVCFEAAQPADGTDFYFGDLSQRLARRGANLLLLCGNGAGCPWRVFARGHTATTAPYRVSELALVPPLAPMRMALAQLATSLRLWWRARRLPAGARRRLCLLASLESLSPSTALTGLSYWVGREAARCWKPRAVVTLYEGHAWEKCLWRGVKDADPSCRVVGYQHTAIFQESRAILAPQEFGDASVPDAVLGLGPAPLEMLREGHAPYGTRLMPLGALRHPVLEDPRPPAPARRTVLVTPEGIASEITALFTFAHACARALPSYTFILRCHPQIPMAAAIRLVAVDLAGQPNIVLSEHRTLQEDLERASVLFYRGSSSVIYAVRAGLLPLYLRPEGRDPLEALRVWRRSCATPEEAERILAAFEGASAPALAAEWEEAIRYVEAYTGPVTEARMSAWCDWLGLAPKRISCAA